METISGRKLKPERGRGKSRDTDLPWANWAGEIPSSQLRTEKVRAALGRGLLGGEGRLGPGSKGIPHSEAAWPHSPTRGHSILPAHPPSLCSDATLRRDLPWPSYQKPLFLLLSITEPSYVFLHDNLKSFICLSMCLCIYSLSPLLN